MTGRVRAAQREEADRADEAKRTRKAFAIWNEAQHPRGTPVKTYLQGRGLSLPDEAAGEAIRFHPSCSFGLTCVPVMVALVRDVRHTSQSDPPHRDHRERRKAHD